MPGLWISIKILRNQHIPFYGSFGIGLIEANIDLVSSIPFSYPNNSLSRFQSYLKKVENNPKLNILFSRNNSMLSLHIKLREGGFFIMIGKKKVNIVISASKNIFI